MEILKMAVSKGALQSKTIRAGWLTTLTSLTGLLTLLSENAAKIQEFLSGVIPAPFDGFVQPAMTMIVLLAHLYLGKAIKDGRDDAAKSTVRIKGLFKPKAGLP